MSEVIKYSHPQNERQGYRGLYKANVFMVPGGVDRPSEILLNITISTFHFEQKATFLYEAVKMSTLFDVLGLVFVKRPLLEMAPTILMWTTETSDWSKLTVLKKKKWANKDFLSRLSRPGWCGEQLPGTFPPLVNEQEPTWGRWGKGPFLDLVRSTHFCGWFW